MSFFENFKTAFFNIFSSKMRTFLTTLGIIIGITSVMVITAIGDGFQEQIDSNFSSFNADTVSISTSYKETIRDSDELKLKDVESLKNLVNINYVTPIYSTNVEVKLKNPKETDTASLYGVNEQAGNIEKLTILYGRFLQEQEVTNSSNVCVIDNNFANDVFGRTDVTGETIDVTVLSNDKTLKLTVVGVYETEEQGLFSTSTIYAPIELVMDAGDADDKISSINLILKNTNLLNQTKIEALRVISANHNNSPVKYSFTGNFEILEIMQSTIQIFTIFIGFVASISLLVGGIGVMNIMLVTVTERTREIGIRKSLGATNNNIKMQFLIESLSISLFGGIMGILFGYFGTYLSAKVLKLIGNSIVPSVSLVVVFFAVVVSSFIGIVFGVYPASKAAKLDPIEALRYE